MKKSYSIRLDDEIVEWLKRDGRSWSRQLRRDLRSWKLVKQLCSEGMSDRPMGAMVQLAEGEIKE